MFTRSTAGVYVIGSAVSTENRSDNECESIEKPRLESVIDVCDFSHKHGARCGKTNKVATTHTQTHSELFVMHKLLRNTGCVSANRIYDFAFTHGLYAVRVTQF